MRVRTVTTVARNQSAQGDSGGTDHAPAVWPSVQVEVMERGTFERPGGRRFGVLVHAILASIDLDADLESIRSMAAVIGRMVTATEDEVSAASIAVRAVLEHPILRRAAASSGSGRLRRETPVLHRLENGELIEGVVDLAFQEEDSTFTGWTVIDFKTDREPGPSSDRYVAQVRMYAQAIATATALPARGVVLVMFDQIASAAGHVTSGGVRALAVTTDRRMPFLPDTPTVAEAGMPELAGTSWAGIMAPLGTPPEIILRLISRWWLF